jgi:hypothetical protein
MKLALFLVLFTVSGFASAVTVSCEGERTRDTGKERLVLTAPISFEHLDYLFEMYDFRFSRTRPVIQLQDRIKLRKSVHGDVLVLSNRFGPEILSVQIDLRTGEGLYESQAEGPYSIKCSIN